MKDKTQNPLTWESDNRSTRPVSVVPVALGKPSPLDQYPECPKYQWALSHSTEYVFLILVNITCHHISIEIPATFLSEEEPQCTRGTSPHQRNLTAPDEHHYTI